MKVFRKTILSLLIVTVTIISGLTSSATFSEPIESSEAPIYPEFIYHDVQAGAETYTVPKEMFVENDVSENIISPKTIIGADTRSQVTNVNTDPFRHYVYIVTEFDNGAIGTSTGFLIGNKTVATAAHNVYYYCDDEGDSCTGHEASKISVYPGGLNSQYNASTVGPLMFHQNWYLSNGTDRRYDYAVLKLRSSYDIGYMNLDSVTDSELTSMKNSGDNLYTFGYPYDKTEGTLWCSTGSIMNYDSDSIRNYIDVVKGNSGGPLVTFDDRNTALGICITESETYNKFLRFNSTNLAEINTWRNQYEN